MLPQTTEENILQLAAWLGSATVALIAIIQFGLGFWRQRRETRIAQAKFAYELLDQMFADDYVNEFLYSLDGAASVHTKDSSQVFISFKALFGSADGQVPDELKILACSRLDSFLYYADRFEHAIGAKLTTAADVTMPLQYYVHLLAPYRQQLQPYMMSIGYERAVALFSRFDSKWRA